MDFTRLAVVAALLVTLGAFAMARRMRSPRSAWAPPVPRMDSADLPGGGPPADLFFVLFKSRFCGACRETPALVAAAAPGVPLVELNVSEQKGLAARYRLRETPTLLLVDRALRIRLAYEGNPDTATLSFWVEEAIASRALQAAPLAGRKRSA